MVAPRKIIWGSLLKKARLKYFMSTHKQPSESHNALPIDQILSPSGDIYDLNQTG